MFFFFFNSTPKEIPNFYNLPVENFMVPQLRWCGYYRKIHYLTREFHVKLHAKTDIARIAKR